MRTSLPLLWPWNVMGWERGSQESVHRAQTSCLPPCLHAGHGFVSHPSVQTLLGTPGEDKEIRVRS